MGFIDFLKGKKHAESSKQTEEKIPATEKDSLADTKRSEMERLLAELIDKNPRIALAASDKILKIGSSAVPPLVIALQDKNPDLRSWAASLLGRIVDIKALDGLIGALNDDDDKVCANVINALGCLNDARAIDPLLSSLKHKSPTVRSSAAFALGGFVSGKVVGSLINALSDDMSDVRVAAANSLGKVKDSSAREPLTKLLGNETDPDARRYISEALSMLGDSIGDENLLHQLKSGNAGERWAAVRSIGEIGDKRFISPLIDGLQDANADVRKETIVVLSKIAGQNLGSDINSWREWWNNNKPK